MFSYEETTGTVLLFNVYAITGSAPIIIRRLIISRFDDMHLLAYWQEV